MKSQNFLGVRFLSTLSTKRNKIMLVFIVRYQQKFTSPAVSSSSPSEEGDDRASKTVPY